MAFLLRPGDECVMANNFSVGGRQAFRQGDIVKIIEISPDRLQPGNKYLVQSKLLGEQVRLPGVVLQRARCPGCGERLKQDEGGGFSGTCECGWNDPETSHYRELAKMADTTIRRADEKRKNRIRLPDAGGEETDDGGFDLLPEDSRGTYDRIGGGGDLIEKAVAWRNEKLGPPAEVPADACPVCASAALTGQDTCPACHHKLKGPQFADGESVDPGAYFCPSCHTQLEADPLDCPSCGWRFKRDDEAQRAKLGYVKRDILIGGQVAFREGELVRVESESPDPRRPEYRYVVCSQAMGTKYRLSDADLDC